MISAIEFLWVPFLACLVLTGIHVYLGLHVLARGIIFVDLALARSPLWESPSRCLPATRFRAEQPTGMPSHSHWPGVSFLP